MKSVETALTLVRDNVKTLGKTDVPTAHASGYVLSNDVQAPIDLPLFRQSAMDGYAVRWKEADPCCEFVITGEAAAGTAPGKLNDPGDAVRIFTGAPVPMGADTVIRQEDTNVSNGKLSIKKDVDIKEGGNIRLPGSDITKGTVALKAGSRLNPAGMGLAAALGFKRIPVYKRPTVAILTSGNELHAPGSKLGAGQIYDSNSFTIRGVLHDFMSIRPVWVDHMPDTLEACTQKVSHALEIADIVITAGGISVGKYDHLQQAFANAGVDEVFYKVAQKPGKPLYFGKKGHRLVFGLPGNPAAVLVAMYIYVWRAILLQQGYTKQVPEKEHFALLHPVAKKPGRSYFLKGIKVGSTVMALKGQESHILSDFSKADCLIYAPAEAGKLEAGSSVLIYNLKTNLS